MLSTNEWSHYPLLSAMLAPALFLTASSSLLQNANNRLARISDRLRAELGLASAPAPENLDAERIAGLRRRVMIVLRSIRWLQLAIASFVLTSLAIAVDSAFALGLPQLPAGFAVLGVLLLLTGTLGLWREANLAVDSLNALLDRRSGPQRLPRDAPASPEDH
jgi:hypothetical protein